MRSSRFSDGKTLTATRRPLNLSGTTPGTARRLAPYLTVGFVFAGSIKGSAVLSWVPVDLTLLLAVGAAIAVGLTVLAAGTIPRAATRATMVFGLFLLPLLWTHFTPYASQKVGKLFTLTLLSALAPAALVRSRSDVARFVRALALTCTLVTILALAAPKPVSSYAGARLGSPSGAAIPLGVSAAVVLVIGTLGMANRVLPVLIAVGAVVVGGAGLLASGSRGPLAGAIVAVTAAMLLAPGRPRLVKFIAVTAVVAFGIWFGLSAAPEQSSARLLSLNGNDLVAGPSSQVRINFYRLSLVAIAQNPLGTGWGGFERIGGFYYPHDVPLEITLEAGWVSGAVFLLYLISAMRRAREKARGFQGGVIFALLLLLLFEALVSGDINDNRTLFLLIGIAFANAGLSTTRRSGTASSSLQRPERATGMLRQDGA